MTGAEIPSQQIRRIIVEQSKRAHVGHIGSALSITDIITVLYSHVLKNKAPRRSSTRPFHPLKRACCFGCLCSSVFAWMDNRRDAQYLLHGWDPVGRLAGTCPEGGGLFYRFIGTRDCRMRGPVLLWVLAFSAPRDVSLFWSAMQSAMKGPCGRRSSLLPIIAFPISLRSLTSTDNRP